MLSKELTMLQKVGSSIVQIINNGRNCSLLCRNENSAGAKINKSHCLANSSAKECKYQNSKSLFYNLVFVEDLRIKMDFIMYLKREIPEYSRDLFAEESDQGGPVRRSGGRLGKIDAANEDGFFFKTDKSRLERIRRELRAKEEDEDEDEDDDDPPAKPQQKSGTK